MSSLIEVGLHTQNGLREDPFYAGLVLAATVRQSHRLELPGLVSLDGDGVVAQNDAFDSSVPLALHPDTLPAIADFAASTGVQIGLATSRGPNFAEWMGRHVEITGPQILSGGAMTVTSNGEVTLLAHPKYPAFQESFTTRLRKAPSYAPDWPPVQTSQGTHGATMCEGNPQWRTPLSQYVWFVDRVDPNHPGLGKPNKEVVDNQIRPLVVEAALEVGLEPEKDVAISGTRMPIRRVVMVGIKAAKDGVPRNKADAAHVLPPHTALVIDGPGDDQIRKKVQSKNGAAIGIKGSPDRTPEIEHVLRGSNAIVDPWELALVFDRATNLLTNRGRRHFV